MQYTVTTPEAIPSLIYGERKRQPPLLKVLDELGIRVVLELPEPQWSRE